MFPSLYTFLLPMSATGITPYKQVLIVAHMAYAGAFKLSTPLSPKHIPYTHPDPWG